MPPVAEHHVADDQEAPFIAEHFQREIDRAAGAADVGHVRFQTGESGRPKKKLLAILHQLSQDTTSCKTQSVLGSAAMAKLIMWNLMTLDGFVEGPNRDISWHLDVWGEELEQLSIEQLNAAGGLLFGRVTYELMANHWPNAAGTVADFMNATPKYVFSRTLTQSAWNNTRMFAGDVADTVTTLKRETRKDIFLFGSADLASHLIPHGLIDEFRIALNPILLGGGTPLFKPGERRRLKLVDSRPLTNGIVILRYLPAAK